MMRGGSRSTSATGASTGACSNGTKTSQVTNADGSATTTTDFYYDAACATLEAEEIITVATPGRPSTTGTGSIVSYSQAGVVRVAQTLGLTVTQNAATSTTPATETFSMVDSASATVGGSPTAGVGASCTGTPPSQTLSCTAAHFGTSNGASFAESLATTATAGASGGNASATVTAAFFSGTGLGIATSSGTWGVTGGTAYNTATGTYGYASTGPAGSGTLTFNDSLYTYVETATLTATGLAITIIENPNAAVTAVTPIAHATVDVAGNGVLTFADGATEPIAGGLLGY
jgi:hypothetical protein